MFNHLSKLCQNYAYFFCYKNKYTANYRFPDSFVVCLSFLTPDFYDDMKILEHTYKIRSGTSLFMFIKTTYEASPVIVTLLQLNSFRTMLMIITPPYMKKRDPTYFIFHRFSQIIPFDGSVSSFMSRSKVVGEIYFMLKQLQDFDTCLENIVRVNSYLIRIVLSA